MFGSTAQGAGRKGVCHQLQRGGFGRFLRRDLTHQMDDMGEELNLPVGIYRNIEPMSTKIIDVTGDSPVEMKGYVPERSVVIPGSYTKKFPAGEYQVPCALIIGKRKESTDKKTSLNDALRDALDPKFNNK